MSHFSTVNCKNSVSESSSRSLIQDFSMTELTTYLNVTKELKISEVKGIVIYPYYYNMWSKVGIFPIHFIKYIFLNHIMSRKSSLSYL